MRSSTVVRVSVVALAVLLLSASRCSPATVTAIEQYAGAAARNAEEGALVVRGRPLPPVPAPEVETGATSLLRNRLGGLSEEEVRAATRSACRAKDVYDIDRALGKGNWEEAIRTTSGALSPSVQYKAQLLAQDMDAAANRGTALQKAVVAGVCQAA